MIDTFIRKPLSMFIGTWYVNLLFQLYIFIISNYRSYISDINLGPKLHVEGPHFQVENS